MRNLIVAVVCCLLIGCSVDPINRSVVHQVPNKITAGNTRTITVEKIVYATEWKKKTAHYYSGLPCWDAGPYDWRIPENFITESTNQLRKKLEEYGYSIAGKAYSPFNEKYVAQSNLLLGGKIIDIQVNLCSYPKGYKGEAYVKIEWEVYDKKANTIVLTLSTEGISSLKKFERNGDAILMRQAFEMAFDNLLASQTFYAFLKKKNIE